MGLVSQLDVAERAQTGPRVEERQRDLALFRATQRLVKEYGVVYPDDGSFFNRDDALVERAYRAAVDFLVNEGVYCTSTNRVVRFTGEEVLTTLRAAPTEVTVGQGRDARVLKQRRIEEHEALNQVPAHHVPFTEDVVPQVVPSFARMPSADYLQGFSFREVDGRYVFGMPVEAYAARRQIDWLHAGACKAGRPGLAVAYYPVNTRAGTLLAPLDLLRPCDGILLTILPDLKIEADMLSASVVYTERGCFIVNGGGASEFASGIEGGLIIAIATAMAGWLCYRGHFAAPGAGPVHGVLARPGTGEAATARGPALRSWANSLVRQVLNTRTNTICFTSMGGPSGLGTKEHLLELAIAAISSPMNGSNLGTIRVSGKVNTEPNKVLTPVEPEWVWEVAQAAMRARLDRPTADEIVRELSVETAGGPEGPYPDIRECYDLVRQRPMPEYEQVWREAREHLAGAGLIF